MDDPLMVNEGWLGAFRYTGEADLFQLNGSWPTAQGRDGRAGGPIHLLSDQGDPLLAGYDFAASEINEALVCQLLQGDFIENANDVVLIDGLRPAKAIFYAERLQGDRIASRSRF